VGDGFDDIVLASDTLMLFLSPRRGGSAFELDYRPGAFNLLDTFTRKPELYHLDIPDEKTVEGDEHASIHDLIRAKESGMRRFLVYDWYRRIGFVDHFLDERDGLDRFAAASFTDLGDFVLEPFTIADTAEKPGPKATLVREGGIFRDGRRFPMTVTKRFSLDPRKAALTAAYSLKFPEGAAGARFACELNLGLQSGYSADSSIEIPGRTLDDTRLASTGVEENVDSILLTVGWMPLHVSIGFSRPATLWRLPVETVSQSEDGAERTYQNTCLVPVWKLDEADGRFDMTITLEVSS
jgi:alpha-amylase